MFVCVCVCVCAGGGGGGSFCAWGQNSTSKLVSAVYKQLLVKTYNGREKEKATVTLQ